MLNSHVYIYYTVIIIDKISFGNISHHSSDGHSQLQQGEPDDFTVRNSELVDPHREVNVTENLKIIILFYYLIYLEISTTDSRQRQRQLVFGDRKKIQKKTRSDDAHAVHPFRTIRVENRPG